jgi:hypothetical protein
MTKAVRDPLEKVNGLTPRYLRERNAAADAAAALLASTAKKPAALDPGDAPSATRPVDASTADLRRRIMAAGSRRVIGVSTFAGVPFVAGLLPE